MFGLREDTAGNTADAFAKDVFSAEVVLGWLRVLGTGLLAASLTILFVFQSLSLFSATARIIVGVSLTDEQREPLVEILASYGVYVFFALVVFLLSSWVSVRARGRHVFYGLTTGVLAAVFYEAVIYFRFPEVDFTEAFFFVLFGALAGSAGGYLGKLRRDRQRAFARAVAGIGQARNVEEVASSLGEHRRADATGVAIWWARSADPDEALGGLLKGPADLVLKARWIPQGRTAEWQPSPPPVAVREETIRRLRTSVVGPSDVGGSDSLEGVCGPGSRSAAVVPLIGPGEAWLGFLIVGSRKKRMVHWMGRDEARDHVAVGSQAALALAKMDLERAAEERGAQLGVMQERQRLAHEIHDTVTQGFVAVVAHLRVVLRAQNSPDQPGMSRWHLDRALQAATENLTEARRLVQGLPPESLQRMTLPDAIEELTNRFSEGEGRLRAEFEVTEGAHPLASEKEKTLYRAAQEGLQNVRKHAEGATRVKLTLSYIGDRVALDIRDDGFGKTSTCYPGWLRPEAPGVSAPALSGGEGLRYMKKQVEDLGGTLTFLQSEGRGATLTVELPAADENEVEEPS